VIGVQKRKVVDTIVITAFILFYALVCYHGTVPDVLGGVMKLMIDGDSRELNWVLSRPAYALGNLTGLLFLIGIFSWIWLKVSKRLFKEK